MGSQLLLVQCTYTHNEQRHVHGYVLLELDRPLDPCLIASGSLVSYGGLQYSLAKNDTRVTPPNLVHVVINGHVLKVCRP